MSGSPVRNLERAGVPRSVAMAVVGHKTESVYRRYAIIAEGDLQEAARRLDAMSSQGGVAIDQQPKARPVFVSYSRVDQALVGPLVQVLRTIGGRVFQDVESIPPGKLWRSVIKDSIDDASVVLVFWCEHSKRSQKVRREWVRGIRAQKDVVPALLDSTPLDARLAKYQGIDLRPLVTSHPTHEFEIGDSRVGDISGAGGLTGAVTGWLFSPLAWPRILWDPIARRPKRRAPHRSEIDERIARSAAVRVLDFLEGGNPE